MARDLIERGFRIAIPYGEDWDFDLIFQRPDSDRLERAQVKYAESRPDVMPVRRCSHSLTNGKVRHTKKYTAATIDWLAVYDRVTDRCYYIPASVLGEQEMRQLHLRFAPTRNCQVVGIRYANDFLDPSPAKVEPAGIEPATS